MSPGRTIGIIHLNDEPLTDLYNYIIQFGGIPTSISPYDEPRSVGMLIITDCRSGVDPLSTAFINGHHISVISTGEHMVNHMVSYFFDYMLEKWLATNTPIAFFGNSTSFAVAALGGKLEMVHPYVGKRSIIPDISPSENLLNVQGEIYTAEINMSAKVITLDKAYVPVAFFTKATRTKYLELSEQEKPSARAYPVMWINTAGKILLSQTVPWKLKNTVDSLNKIQFGYNFGDPVSNNFMIYLFYHGTQNSTENETVSP